MRQGQAFVAATPQVRARDALRASEVAPEPLRGGREADPEVGRTWAETSGGRRPRSWVEEVR